MIRSERPLWRASVGLLTSVALAFVMMPPLVNGIFTHIKAGSNGGYLSSGLALACWVGLTALSLLAVGARLLALRLIWIRVFAVVASFIALNVSVWHYSASLDSDDLRHAGPWLFILVAAAAAGPPGRALRFLDRWLAIQALSAGLLLVLALSTGWVRILL
jgi:hypothetical protein